MEMLLAEIKETKSLDRGAYFNCVLALATPDEKCVFFEGRVDGDILEEKSGNGGFGFDPVFMPKGFDKSFAEFSKDEKNHFLMDDPLIQRP